MSEAPGAAKTDTTVPVARDARAPVRATEVRYRAVPRPAPQHARRAVFIEPGDTVRQGQTIGLLEVMKTFNRLVYQGDTVPKVAVVSAIVPADGDDVVRGDVILALKPAT